MSITEVDLCYLDTSTGETESVRLLPVGSDVWVAGRRGTIFGHVVANEGPVQILYALRLRPEYGDYLRSEDLPPWYVSAVLVDPSSVDEVIHVG